MASEHTPGPWSIQQDDSPEHEYEHAHVLGPDGSSLAIVEYDENGDANARLIREAPRMLAILQELSVLADVIALPDALPMILAILRDVEGESNG